MKFYLYFYDFINMNILTPFSLLGFYLTLVQSSTGCNFNRAKLISSGTLDKNGFSGVKLVEKNFKRVQ